MFGAKNMGRKYVGYELYDSYKDVINEKLGLSDE
jgi:DNA modification methylase